MNDGDISDADIARACAGAPGWITPQLVRNSVRTLQPYYPTEVLTADEGVEILTRMGELFRIIYDRPEDQRR